MLSDSWSTRLCLNTSFLEFLVKAGNSSIAKNGSDIPDIWKCKSGPGSDIFSSHSIIVSEVMKEILLFFCITWFGFSGISTRFIYNFIATPKTYTNARTWTIKFWNVKYGTMLSKTTHTKSIFFFQFALYCESSTALLNCSIVRFMDSFSELVDVSSVDNS